MHYIYVLMGKSCAGKNAIAEKLLDDKSLALHRVVTYTTRPMRSGEKDGREYRFVTRSEYSSWAEAGTIIDAHEYQTVNGLWFYFTADDGQIDLSDHDSLIIGTPSIIKNLQGYFGTEYVVPILIDVPDEELLRRALGREAGQTKPNYAETCRRFLADKEDFSDSIIESLGHVHVIRNDNFLGVCAAKIARLVKNNRESGRTKTVTFEMAVPAIRYGSIDVPIDDDVDEEYIRERWDRVRINDNETLFNFDKSSILITD